MYFSNFLIFGFFSLLIGLESNSFTTIIALQFAMMEDTNMQGDRDGAIVNLNPTLATTISDDDVKLVANMDACEEGGEAEGKNGTPDDAGQKRKSPVWNKFSKITLMVKGVHVKKGKCKYCKENIVIKKSRSTNQFIRHMQKCIVHLASFKKQKLLTRTDFFKLGATNGKLGIFKFSKENVREYMDKMIIVLEYPFRMGEHEFFLALLSNVKCLV